MVADAGCGGHSRGNAATTLPGSRVQRQTASTPEAGEEPGPVSVDASSMPSCRSRRACSLTMRTIGAPGEFVWCGMDSIQGRFWSRAA
jgi:hypothetical protein